MIREVLGAIAEYVDHPKAGAVAVLLAIAGYLAAGFERSEALDEVQADIMHAVKVELLRRDIEQIELRIRTLTNLIETDRCNGCEWERAERENLKRLAENWQRDLDRKVAEES